MASYYFYMCWKVEYVILIIISTLVDYIAGIQMGKATDKSRKRKFLVLSLVINLGLLFVFKYYNFFNDSARAVFNHFNIFYNVPAFDLLLPVGISFYTFQTLSYSLDVYRGTREPEKHLGIFAIYVAFFPQLVAGPIERSTRLLPQFREEKTFDYLRVTNGLKLILWGFFKKLVIADRLAVYVNEVFSSPGDYSGVSAILASYLFVFQIYCDFSAYSDIAIGSAQTMGYRLNLNFRRPFFSRSISEFWERWHISLTTWVRDYFTWALIRTKMMKGRKNSIIFVSMTVIGLWHGAAWTYVLWGALNGFYLVFSNWTKKIRKKMAVFFHLEKAPVFHYALQVFIVFNLFFLPGILFRANSISDVFVVIKNLVYGGTVHKGFMIDAVNGYEMTISFIAISFMLCVEAVQEYFYVKKGKGLREVFANVPIIIRWPVYYIIIYSIFMFGEFELAEFIYFQF